MKVTKLLELHGKLLYIKMMWFLRLKHNLLFLANLGILHQNALVVEN